jgi:carbon monoxide dehydrogenase subunit G
VTVQLDNEFTIPVPVAEAWPVLLDVERIAPCMPGATVTKVDGPNIEGVVKVKVGPITVSYSGTATFLETDEAARRVVIEARGKETRGSGTASARVTTQLNDEGGSTRVTVSTDLSVTGKPAQFGRGVMADVSNKLLGQFADCLSRKLAAGDSPAAAKPAPDAEPAAAAPAAAAQGQPVGAPASQPGGTPAGQPGGAPATVLDAAPARAASRPVPAPARETDDAIDLLGTAGLPILKRAAPLLAGLLLLALLIGARRRRRG